MDKGKHVPIQHQFYFTIKLVLESEEQHQHAHKRSANGLYVSTYLKTVEYLPIEEIDFTSACGKKKLDQSIHDSSEATTEPHHSTVHGTKSTESELEDLFSKLEL